MGGDANITASLYWKEEIPASYSECISATAQWASWCGTSCNGSPQLGHRWASPLCSQNQMTVLLSSSPERKKGS